MKHLISTTIATYNVADFIAANMDCIIGQTYSTTETLCIDDGSKVGTRAILNEYSAKDKRIRVIAKEKNEGLAVARNLSLKKAKAKYILFVDGDDLFDTSMVEKLVAVVERDRSEVVLWDYCAFVSENKISEKRARPSSLLKILHRIKKL
tara:strand:+ start:2792 stop:3241 length:450 start_codon:yes stop_codon:yes gene_type:complete